VFGQTGRGGNEHLKAEVRPFPVNLLGTFFIGIYDYFIFTGNSGCQHSPRPAQFGFGKAVNIGKPQTQCYPGVNLVNILPPRAAGSGKVYNRRGADRLPQKDKVHFDTLTS
jgi:hypothetical protein